MKRKNILIIALLLTVGIDIPAHSTGILPATEPRAERVASDTLTDDGKSPLWLSLDSCRSLAIRNNKQLRMAGMKREAARNERRAAFTNYLPRVSASGAYLHSTRELSLLSNEQKASLEQLGTTLGTALPSLGNLSSTLDGVGTGLVDALHTNTRNMGAAGVMLTQPLYTGGKIAAYNRVTKYAEQIAARQQDLALQELIVEVDEAYWQIVSLRSKERLALGYLQLLQQLDSDVQRLIHEGLSTRADGLSVKVKLNEAEVSLIQVRNGLELSHMLLCQLCGLPMDTLVEPLEEENASCATATYVPFSATGTARPELHILALSADIRHQQVRLARAEYLPSLALTGGWIGSNPSVFNSFEHRFKGMWNVGVVLNVPLLTWGERLYKVRAARAEERLSRYHWEEACEQVELQVSQSRQKLHEANERLRAALRGCEEAEENLRHARLGMQEGVIPVSNVLEAQAAWLSAHSVCVTARMDLHLADLYLRKSSGFLTVDR